MQDTAAASRVILSIFWNLVQHRLRAGWRLLVHLVAMLCMLFVGYIAIGLTIVLSGLATGAFPIEWLVGVVQSCLVIVSVLLACWLVDRRQLRGLGVNRNWFSELVIGLTLGALAMLGIFGFEYAIGWIEVERVGATAGLSSLQLAGSQLAWLVVMIFVGISEELLSRGYHMKNLSEGLEAIGAWRSVVVAGIISSLVFGVLHALNPAASWASTLGVTLAGLMLATARIATGSLAAPIGLHISWNLFQGPVLGFPVSGQATANSVIEIAQGGDPIWTGGEFGPEAGLIGVVATLSLLLIMVAWARFKRQTPEHVIALADFQDRRLQSVA